MCGKGKQESKQCFVDDAKPVKTQTPVIIDLDTEDSDDCVMTDVKVESGFLVGSRYSKHNSEPLYVQTFLEHDPHHQLAYRQWIDPFRFRVSPACNFCKFTGEDCYAVPGYARCIHCIKEQRGPQQCGMRSSSANVKSETIRSTKVPSIKAESVKAESVKAESVKAESVKVESVKVESVKVEPIKAESAKVESIKEEAIKGTSFEANSISSNDRVGARSIEVDFTGILPMGLDKTPLKSSLTLKGTQEDDESVSELHMIENTESHEKYDAEDHEVLNISRLAESQASFLSDLTLQRKETSPRAKLITQEQDGKRNAGSDSDDDQFKRDIAAAIAESLAKEIRHDTLSDSKKEIDVVSYSQFVVPSKNSHETSGPQFWNPSSLANFRKAVQTSPTADPSQTQTSGNINHARDGTTQPNSTTKRKRLCHKPNVVIDTSDDDAPPVLILNRKKRRNRTNPCFIIGDDSDTTSNETDMDVTDDDQEPIIKRLVRHNTKSSGANWLECAPECCEYCKKKQPAANFLYKGFVSRYQKYCVHCRIKAEEENSEIQHCGQCSTIKPKAEFGVTERGFINPKCCKQCREAGKQKRQELHEAGVLPKDKAEYSLDYEYYESKSDSYLRLLLNDRGLPTVDPFIQYSNSNKSTSLVKSRKIFSLLEHACCVRGVDFKPPKELIFDIHTRKNLSQMMGISIGESKRCTLCKELKPVFNSFIGERLPGKPLKEVATCFACRKKFKVNKANGKATEQAAKDLLSKHKDFESTNRKDYADQPISYLKKVLAFRKIKDYDRAGDPCSTGSKPHYTKEHMITVLVEKAKENAAKLRRGRENILDLSPSLMIETGVTPAASIYDDKSRAAGRGYQDMSDSDKALPLIDDMLHSKTRKPRLLPEKTVELEERSLLSDTKAIDVSRPISKQIIPELKLMYKDTNENLRVEDECAMLLCSGDDFIQNIRKRKQDFGREDVIHREAIDENVEMFELKTARRSKRIAKARNQGGETDASIVHQLDCLYVHSSASESSGDDSDICDEDPSPDKKDEIQDEEHWSKKQHTDAKAGAARFSKCYACKFNGQTYSIANHANKQYRVCERCMEDPNTRKCKACKTYKAVTEFGFGFLNSMDKKTESESNLCDDCIMQRAEKRGNKASGIDDEDIDSECEEKQYYINKGRVYCQKLCTHRGIALSKKGPKDQRGYGITSRDIIFRVDQLATLLADRAKTRNAISKNQGPEFAKAQALMKIVPSIVLGVGRSSPEAIVPRTICKIHARLDSTFEVLRRHYWENANPEAHGFAFRGSAKLEPPRSNAYDISVHPKNMPEKPAFVQLLKWQPPGTKVTIVIVGITGLSVDKEGWLMFYETFKHLQITLLFTEIEINLPPAVQAGWIPTNARGKEARMLTAMTLESAVDAIRGLPTIITYQYITQQWQRSYNARIGMQMAIAMETLPNRSRRND